MSSVRVPVALLFLSLLPVALRAQAASKPAPELAKFQSLIGDWKGSGGGKAATPDGVVEYAWTSVSRYRLVLGGHFIEETTRIEVDGWGAIGFRVYLGYNRHTKTFRQHVIDNMTGVATADVQWIDDKSWITASRSFIDGEVKGERVVTKIVDADNVEFECREWVGGGDETPTVYGKMHRVDELPPIDIDAVAPMIGPVAEMASVRKMSGTYKFRGMLAMSPEQKLDIAGTESIDPVFGGVAVRVTIVGDPIPGMGSYQSFGAIGWNPSKGCYSVFYCDNMGDAMVLDGWMRPAAFVQMATMVVDGRPSVLRGIAHLGEDGKLQRATEDRMDGESAPLRGFDCTYEMVDR